MGGALSEVGPGTRTIVLESACFEPRSVRRTSRRLALKTEASARFERGADIEAPVLGIERACALFEDIGAGRVRRRPHRLLPRTRARQARRASARPDRPAARPACRRRGRRADPVGSGLRRQPRRGRLGGDGPGGPGRRGPRGGPGRGDRHVTTATIGCRSPFPALAQPSPAADPRIERDRLVRRVLAAGGLSEAISFSFIEARAADLFAHRGRPGGHRQPAVRAVRRAAPVDPARPRGGGRAQPAARVPERGIVRDWRLLHAARRTAARRPRVDGRVGAGPLERRAAGRGPVRRQGPRRAPVRRVRVRHVGRRPARSRPGSSAAARPR